MEIPKMIELLPEGKIGDAEIRHRVVTPSESQFSALRGGLAYVDPGTYAMLLIREQIVMSDTRMERSSNYEVISRANGKVLIAGLGIGMILTAILQKPEVAEILVVEDCEDVIQLVAPHIQKIVPADKKLEIIRGDIFAVKRKLKELKPFDTIYFDIWSTICTDHLTEIATLHHMYKNFLNRRNPKAWMGSWMQGYLKSLRRQDYVAGEASRVRKMCALANERKKK